MNGPARTAAAALTAVGAVIGSAAAGPAPLPGPADASRIPQREEPPTKGPPLSKPAPPPAVAAPVRAPEQSRSVTLVLRDVRIEGMTVFTPAEVTDLYASLLGRETTLDVAWSVAARLTERYRARGYFLTTVVVPQQEIRDGVVVLRAVEGYIGEVRLTGPLARRGIVQAWLDRLRAYRPVRADQIESVLLHLNDLPGVSLQAVLEPMETSGASDGGVRLVLDPRPAPRLRGTIGVDNNGSRFLGPNEAQIQAQAVTLPLQRTSLNVLSSLPFRDIQYYRLKHEAPLFPGATGEIYGSFTRSAPGFTLAPEQIRSRTVFLGAAFDYSIIRQRQENLSLRLALEAQNTHSDVKGAPLTRDAIRAARATLAYEIEDPWGGQNSLTTTVSRGLNAFGASPAGARNLSRASARPDFTKASFDASRLQPLGRGFSLLASTSAQVASGPLYSSEQFGYGGQAYGRAYDNSEITGDKGLNASVELQYSAPCTPSGPVASGANPDLGELWRVQTTYFAFYDVGSVWSRAGTTNLPYASGSSVGLGLRISTKSGLSGVLGLAQPVTRRIANPIDGNGRSPRYIMGLTYAF